MIREYQTKGDQMTIVTGTTYSVLPSMDVRLIVDVYSDEPIRYMDAFFRGVVKGQIEHWGIIETLGDQGLRICSDWLTVKGTESVEEVFSYINPGFYESNTKIQYQFSSVTPLWVPGE